MIDPRASSAPLWPAAESFV